MIRRCLECNELCKPGNYFCSDDCFDEWEGSVARMPTTSFLADAAPETKKPFSKGKPIDFDKIPF
jgi:hypothetical protein